ncbi:unnamed protein product [Ectocarpus sp. CCAP 1310/34]|nr:unnamed protein product [Ectocarpus sp. CCAP 1310/34]
MRTSEGTNLVATALHYQFMELTLSWGHTLVDVTVHVDNTVAENMNNYFMGILAAMVGRGIMRTVTLCFMMVGHTHIQVDQIFSCLAKAVGGVEIFTREEVGDAFRRGYKKIQVKCRTLEHLANFKELVAPVTRRIPIITNYRAFKIYKKGPSVVVTVKKKMHHEDWLGFSEDGKTVGSRAGFRPWRLMHAHAVYLKATPPYELKLVQDEIIHRGDLRQQASWENLPVANAGGFRRRL